MTFQNRAPRNNSYSQGRSMQRSTNSSPDTMLMQIAYTDTMGERIVVEKEVKIGLQNIGSENGTTAFQERRGAVQQDIFSTYIWYFLGMTVLVGGVVVHRKYKSRKLIDPDFKIKDVFKIEKK
ncbi:MAG: hypothetical protein J5U16_08860, partial [Candidatus Methanoperedens sp.]|nr:hypothetical protein [Candidatus Methanoperedens sp.]